MESTVIERIAKYIIDQAPKQFKSQTLFSVPWESVYQVFGVDLDEFINNLIIEQLYKSGVVISANTDTDGFDVLIRKNNKSKSIDRIMGGIALVSTIVPFNDFDLVQYGKELYNQQGQSICDILGAWCIRNNVCMESAIDFLKEDTHADKSFGKLISSMVRTYHYWKDKYNEYGMISNEELLELEIAPLTELDK